MQCRLVPSRDRSTVACAYGPEWLRTGNDSYGLFSVYGLPNALRAARPSLPRYGAVQAYLLDGKPRRDRRGHFFLLLFFLNGAGLFASSS